MKCLLIGLVAAVCLAGQYPGNIPLEHPAIRYTEPLTSDRVAPLVGTRIDSLADLLQRLDVKGDSQALVFSKTSFQGARVSPSNPRSVFFSDDVAVGYVPGGSGIEIAAIDARQGAIFYTLDSSGQLRRQTVCLQCHQGPATLGVPGIFIGSVLPNSLGQPSRAQALVTDHRTAFADRWGGWFVSGVRGEQRGRANAVASGPDTPELLDQRITVSGVSDPVALMTFEHQTTITNMLTRLGWEARIGQVGDSEITDAARYMLLKDEVLLREPVEGVSTFAHTFPARGPRDSKGRSLRDFDLKSRLFRYPLSYMIYSAAFDALPEGIRDRLYRSIVEGLRDSPERTTILEILADTKTNLPVWWRTLCQ
jgi:hypothetical protein